MANLTIVPGEESFSKFVELLSESGISVRFFQKKWEEDSDDEGLQHWEPQSPEAPTLFHWDRLPVSVKKQISSTHESYFSVK